MALVTQTEPAPPKSTEAESDRRTAIWLALNAIKRFVKSPFRTEFSPLDREDILPEGIVAKAIDMGEHEGFSFSDENLKSAAMVPLDAMRNNSNKLVNQDMDVVPLEEMNLYAECILRQVAENMHDSKLMSRYVEELTKKDREKWQQSQVCMAMMKGGKTVCEYIEAKAEEHLIRLTSRMEWFPIAYHLADKVALVIFPVLAYYTGKYHLNDTMTFLWAMAFMPIFVLSAIWGINELATYLERRKKKPKSRR